MNIICICLDTFRADIIGQGKKYSHAQTPNLDAFAAESIRFTQAFGEGQPTLQIRRGLFTGMRSFPWRYNFDRRGHWHHASGWHKIPPEQDTIAEVLLERGYLTALIADTYHMFKPTMNFSRGFAHLDFIRGQESDNWRSGDPRLVQDQLRQHVREPINWQRHAGLVNYLLNQRHRRSEDDYSCARVFRAASEWLDDNHTVGPFFLWIDSFDPHEPWDPPPGYADAYLPDYSGKDFITPGTAYEAGDPTEDELRRVEVLYLGEVTFVDKCIGRLLSKIEELKLHDDTLVVLLSDHGTQLRDQGRFGKNPEQLHPFNTQLNLMIRHPEQQQGQEVDAFVQNHDLMPTLLHQLGIPCDWTDGEDFWQLVTGEQSSIRDRIIIGWAGFATGNARGRVSVRDERWNFCTAVGYDDPDGDELFDLADDPAEIHNVAENHPAVVKACRAEVEGLLGQPLPGRMIEVCDPAVGPMTQWLQHPTVQLKNRWNWTMVKAPQSSLLTESNMALFADYYEFTMGKADFDSRNNAICTENYFVRSIPQGEYLIVAGLEQVIHYILNLRFTNADLKWLKESKATPDMSDDFLDYLRHFKFDGDVYAVPEGTPVFANEPLINVTGRSIDIQIFETYLLNVMNFQTLIATKTARIVHAARGRACFDFGARRAHGRDAGILAARASFIGGAAGTSLVIAGQYFNIPYVGTIAHKFIMDRPSELAAFRDYAKSFPHNTLLLIDTYDTIQGAKNACIVAKEMQASGAQLRGVRLDSGDLLALSKAVREIFDEAGLTEVQIFASNDLDEFQIDRLLTAGAPIDGFGVGTRLATGANFNPLTGEGGPSALPGVYKHVERIEGEKVTVTMKLSEDTGKSTLPSKKQLHRLYDADGNYVKDVISLWDEDLQDGESLLMPVILKGELVYSFPDSAAMQAKAKAELTRLLEPYKRLTDAEKYPVVLSPGLEDLLEQLMQNRQP